MLIKELTVEDLNARVYETREGMGAAAAVAAADAIREVLRKKEYANVIFAAAPSQN